ncbi:4-coumarate--CoA ligase 1-like [Colias croceus]|uniref:4-coumarate--CoA ligase 1-like n=1 Tax=Colias crocea TaxID=72248 RepID=UPI001E27FC64|nr:4-coumarate--CoA ligase 1-like [Colias croceus]XP_045499625.1 4-coumarate--CoA ligase 1-like [Colias croceus]
MASTLRRTVSQAINKRNIYFSSILQQSTDSKILKSVFKNVEDTNYTVNEFVWQNLDRWPDKTFTVCATTGHGYTYAQTYRMSITFAASLRTKLKLKNDDTVAIILPNVPEYPCITLGILEAGCVISMMNPAYNAHELKRQLEQIKCKAIVASKISYANISEALSAMNKNLPVILIDHDSLPEGTIKFAEFANDLNVDIDCLKSVKRSPKDVAIMPFSSGTTGFPKAVVCTHKSVVSFNKAILDPNIVAIEEASANYQSVLPGILPFFHIFGFNALMLNLMCVGVKLVTLSSFKPEVFLETIVRHRAQHMYAVPPMIIFLGKHSAVTPAHVQSLKTIVCGAASLARSDAEALLKKNRNINFRQGYGLTETNGGISVGKKGDNNHAAVGHVFGSCEVKIADLQTQEALGPNEEGEIWVRGPIMMQGYYENDAANKEVFTEDGWFKTGDIGKYDDDKYLYITDRLKELIKVKGFQVPPAELETILRMHPKVLDCAVIGIKDDITGEAPKAFIVTQPKQTLDPKEILEFVNKQVVAFKNIKEVQFIDSIPKNPAGKILRKDLKAKYC